jgi:hypothetical protein
MPECRYISRDDEASLYLSAFFHKQKGIPNLEMVQVRPVPWSRRAGFSKAVCHHCGEFGHMRAACTNPLPSIAELEAEMDRDLWQMIAKRAHSPVKTI